MGCEMKDKYTYVRLLNLYCMSISFKVQGKPPKKDGSSSMWGKKSEASNIVNLRNAAIKAREGQNIGLLSSRICIDLTIYANEKEIESMGDLDNFVTGICDSLQAADPRANMQDFIQKECIVNPLQPVLFYTDAKVFEINAKKIPIKGNNGYYEVMIKELTDGGCRG